MNLDGRILFGLVCIGLALLLLVVRGLLRLRRWLLWQKRPDFRLRGVGSNYTGGSRHRDVHQPLPFSGLGNYKRGRNHHARKPTRSFWTPSYKGRKFRR